MARAQGTKADYVRAAGLAARFAGKVSRERVTPNWLPDGRFWYRVEIGAGRASWALIDTAGRVARFDTEAALAEALGGTLPRSTVPAYATQPETQNGDESLLEFVNETPGPVGLFWVDDGGERHGYGEVAAGARREMHTYAGHVFEVRDAGGKTLAFYQATAAPATALIDGKPVPPPPPAPDPRRSPDGAWRVVVRGDDLWREPVSGDAAAVALTTDGRPGDSYARSPLYFSPDSKKLVVFRVTPPAEHKVYLVESSPADRVQPKLRTLDYQKPGDAIEHARPVLLDLAAARATPIPDALFPNPWSLLPLDGSGSDAGVTWAADSSRFFFAYNERGHQLLRVLSVDAATGAPHTLFEDRSVTFIDYSGKFFARYLSERDEILWMSERDGWNHLYAHDATTGAVKRQLTKGNWVVRGVERIDAKEQRLLLRVAGIHPGEDPYHVHYARMNIDGSGWTMLTQGDGTHRLSVSPDGARYIDTFSRVDLPPMTELRRTQDGMLLATLETADASALRATGWKMPERFVAKGRDGTTDIHGIVWRPTNYDPRKKWPVIEQIYAGPHGAFVPKAWSSFYGNPQQLAELGFVVVQIDGMGTNFRSKAFHDVAWKNLRDAGLPDHILWLKALAARDPSLDLSRVGIYGGSAGGQNALAALLWHGDFYKVAVADCGCHDNRMDKIWWNEAWMGWPVDRSYEESSNVVNAARLTGKLLLVVGELDDNVDPASTMQVCAALQKADKDFDLVIVAGAGHGAAETPYGRRRRMDFLVRHLLGVEPRREGR
jgi:dipeptidyl aminopeptidase/acylaminoacyl peptidase